LRSRGIIGAALLVAILAGGARAADLPVKAPVPVAAPWSWTGFYVGGNIGGALEYSKLEDPFGPVSFGDRVKTTAFIAGGQVGSNYQIGNVVIGAVANLDWATSRGDETCFGLVGGAFFASNCSVDPTLLGTITGRFGYAFGHTLVYAKGGAAWEHTNVDMAVNNNPGQHFLASANSYGEWGWTVGGGSEYALTRAWSLTLEYDYLHFGTANVATPYVAGNPLPGHPVGPIAGLSSNVNEVKLGINYKLGADPVWSGVASVSPVKSFLPLKTSTLAASGWDIEGGARYMFSSGRAQWEEAFTATPTWFSSSKLTWNNLQTNSSEIFGRVDTPSNIFLSGFVGAGLTFSGGQNDEDFHEPPPDKAYNNTFSTNNGYINYAVGDVGYDIWRNADYKVGPFVGYTFFNQYILKSGCQQVASSTGNCVVPLSNSQLIGSEAMTWQAMRVGLSGQVSLTDRLKLAADVAYLPYVTYLWLDDHLQRNAQDLMGGHGIGVQTQAVLSYDVTDRLSVGIGGRYWSMWSTSGQRQGIPSGCPGCLGSGPNRNAVDLVGAFTQVSYRFAPNSAVAAKPGNAFASIFKAPAVGTASDWTGFYVGIEGGVLSGESKQIGQLTTGGRHTADSTPWFDVNGGLAGGTVGYNAQFYRIFVYGLEGDMSWVEASGSARQIAPFNPTQTAMTSEHWLSTARARIGVTPVDHWLVYATGGVAVADVEASIANASGSIAFPGESHVRAGWTAGGGVEAAITGSWSAKFEYLYVGLENHGYFVPTPNNPAITNRAGGVPLNNDIVRGGINYKINSL
jgi:opacity protein-like surface antigen